MLRKILICCGIAAPVIYVVTVIVGAALRNDYSHIVNAVSELISNGAPNKAILDVIFNIYGALLLAFAIGGYSVLKNVHRFCRCHGHFYCDPNFILFMGILSDGSDWHGSYVCWYDA